MDQRRVDLPSTYSSIERVLDLCDLWGAEFGWDDEFCESFKLIASELATNAVEHGNKLDPLTVVQITVQSERARVTLVVEDEGGGFERSAVDHPLDAESLLAASGRGVFIVEHLADGLSFENEGRRAVVVLNRSVEP